jgi:hypothetical protein
MFSANNSLTSLGLYIAYNAAHSISAGTSSYKARLDKLKTAMTHALSLGKETFTEADQMELLRAASSMLFIMYLTSAYVHGTENKRTLANDMRDLKTQMSLLNAQVQDIRHLHERQPLLRSAALPEPKAFHRWFY